MDGIDISTNQKYELSIYDSIKDIDQKQYDKIQDHSNPFLEYNFLFCLEESGCIGPDTGWDPRYIILSENNIILAALTFFIKTDSYGEYIFDWEWARAYYDAGLPYYPKVVVGIPFTPATGEKILVDKNYNFEDLAPKLINYLIDYSYKQNLSSIHFLFITEKENTLLKKFNFLERITHQYHWHNRDYNSFDDFLGDLRSGRRKQIKKERKRLISNNIQTEIFADENITKNHIELSWQFYLNTNSRKWGNAYLNRLFFELIFKMYRNRTVLILSKNSDTYVGGTINFYKNSKLYGRYWGCNLDVEFLHFECCYYKLIEFAIDNKIKTFEAGAQGEHKFLRGFSAVPIYSSHLLFHEGAQNVISNFLNKEKLFTQHTINRYNNLSPLKHLYGKND